MGLWDLRISVNVNRVKFSKGAIQFAISTLKCLFSHNFPSRLLYQLSIAMATNYQIFNNYNNTNLLFYSSKSPKHVSLSQNQGAGRATYVPSRGSRRKICFPVLSCFLRLSVFFVSWPHSSSKLAIT